MAHPVYVLTVNGAVVPSLRIGFDIREVANGRNRMTLAIYSKTGAPLIALFDEISLTEDGVVIFGGYVDAPTETGAGGQPITPTMTTVSAVDYNQLAERRYANLTFAAGTLASQLATLMGTFGSAGVTLDPTQPAGPALPAWTAAYWRVDDILNQLTTLSHGYLWNITYSKVLAMRLASAVPAPVTVTDANRVALGDVTVTPSAEQFANRVLLLYGDGAHDTTDRHTGDGVTVAFPVTHQHLSNTGVVSVAGVNETLSGPGGGGTWTLAADTTTITRASAPAVGAAIVFVYTALFPALVYADAPGGITTPPGFWEVVITAPDVYDRIVAQTMATDEVAIRSARPRTITYLTHEKGLHPGQSQTITKAARHLTAVPVTISEVTIRNATGGPTERAIVAVEGRFPGTWRDMIKGWNDAGATSGASAPASGGGGSGGGGGGGSIGPGTVGRLAKWTGTGTIGDSIVSESGAAITVAGGVTATTFAGNGAALTNLDAGALATGIVPVARLPQFVGGDVTTAAPGSVNLQLGAGAVGASEIAAGAITNVHISPTAAISWTKIDKTGATLGDFGGNLAWTQLPTGTGTWVANPTISGPLTLTNHLLATSPYTSDVGALTKKYRAIYGAELWVETLVAQKTLATIGGRILIGPTTVLMRDCAPGDAVIFVKHNTFKLHVPGVDYGSTLILEAAGKFEIMQVSDTVTPTPEVDGAYRYNVFRGQASSGADQWYAGDAVFDSGIPGSGFIDLYSIVGVSTSTTIGPSIVGNVRTGTGGAIWEPRWAVGNLNGLYGYAADVYGFAAGVASATHVTIDSTYGFCVRYGAAIYLRADIAGNLSLTGNLTIGTAGSIRSGATAFNDSSIGYWLDYNGGKPRMRIGNPAGDRVSWDGDYLTVVSNTVTIDSSGVSISTLTSPSYSAQYGYKFATNFGGTNWLGLFATHDGISRYLVLQNSTSTTGGATYLTLSAANQGLSANLLLAAPGGTVYAEFNCDTRTQKLGVGGSMAWNAAPTFFVMRAGSSWLAGIRQATHAAHGMYVSGGEVGGASYYMTQAWYAADASTVVGIAFSTGEWTKPVSSTWTIYSDARIKRDVAPVSGVLARLRQVRIVDFEYNGLYGTRAGTRGIGVVAQDIAPIFPRSVSPLPIPRHPVPADRVPFAANDPILCFNPHELFMATVAGLIELDADVRALRAELKGLRDGE